MDDLWDSAAPIALMLALAVAWCAFLGLLRLLANAWRARSGMRMQPLREEREGEREREEEREDEREGEREEERGEGAGTNSEEPHAMRPSKEGEEAAEAMTIKAVVEPAEAAEAADLKETREAREVEAAVEAQEAQEAAPEPGASSPTSRWAMNPTMAASVLVSIAVFKRERRAQVCALFSAFRLRFLPYPYEKTDVSVWTTHVLAVIPCGITYVLDLVSHLEVCAHAASTPHATRTHDMALLNPLFDL